MCVRVCVRACVRVCVCECVCVWNELEVCTKLAYPHISSFRTTPVLYTSTHASSNPLRTANRRGLKVDIGWFRLFVCVCVCGFVCVCVCIVVVVVCLYCCYCYFCTCFFSLSKNFYFFFSFHSVSERILVFLFREYHI